MNDARLNHAHPHPGRVPLILLCSLLLAAAAGVALALLLAPGVAQSRALASITHADPERRAAGWQWLSQPVGHDQPSRSRAHGLLTDAILPRLEAAASDAALLDAGVNLRKLDLWKWSRIPSGLLLRELALRAAMDDIDQHRMTLELMRTVPLDAPADAVVPIIGKLLSSESESVQRSAFEAAWLWAGPMHGDRIAALVTDESARDVQRLNAIALGWAARLSRRSQWINEPHDQSEPNLLAHALAHPNDAQPLVDAVADADEQTAAITAEVARHLNDQAARTVLQQLADRNIATARYALRAMDVARDQQAARDMLEIPTAERWRRRLAAWRLPSISRDQLDDLLFIEQTDPPQPVFDVALLAERHYRRDSLSSLAQQWIASLNDDEKRAGLLLHELGYEAPSDDDVARAMKVFNRVVTNDDFNADRVLMRLAGGDVDALHHLTSQPPLSAANERASGGIIRRTWLIERFVPFWRQQLGRPVGGSRAALDLHFDALEALRLVTQRRLTFNQQRRQFEYQPPEPPPEHSPEHSPEPSKPDS